MVVVSSIAAVREAVAEARKAGSRIGFVPTMGALHDGHLSLVDRAQREAGFTVMSIFVNPLQFGPGEDLSRYPRPVENDEQLTRDACVDLLFRPSVEEIYPRERSVSVVAGDLGRNWEGESRPGHFDGVLTVVAKLFNIVQPDVAVFGRKDLQQAALVRALIRDLDFPIELVVAPIVRERDGVAMSSRNRYLDSVDRTRATALSRALRDVKEKYRGGERNVTALETAGLDKLREEPEIEIDYLAVVDENTFERPREADERSAAIVAARVGTTRLIDNVRLADDQD
jgi:pantoate--beta-alanine ligase